MEKIKMVEALREQADITMEEAKEILERNDWDLLNAMIELEKSGRIHPKKEETQIKELPAAEEKAEQKTKHKKKARCHVLRRTIQKLIRVGLDNRLVITKEDKIFAKVPVVVPVLCFLGSFWITAIALFAGLILGFTYSFEGEELGKQNINHTMEMAGKMTNDVVERFADRAEQEEGRKQETAETEEGKEADTTVA